MALATMADRNAELAHAIDVLIRDYCDGFGVRREYAATLLELKAATLKDNRQ